LKDLDLCEWHIFYKRVIRYPWDLVAHLIANERTHSDLGQLIASYEQLKAEADMHLPHGPGLFRRLDTVSKELGSMSRQ
jgi:hypothetical protein